MKIFFDGYNFISKCSKRVADAEQTNYFPLLVGGNQRWLARWWSCRVKYARCVPLYPLNPILTWYTNPQFGWIFRPQFNPDTVGRRRPADLPSAWGASREGARRRRKFFLKKNQNEWFSLRNLLFSLFLPLYFGWKFVYFMKNIRGLWHKNY